MIRNDANRKNYKVLLHDINFMFTECLSERPGINPGKLRQLGIHIMYQICTAFLDEKEKIWIPVNPSLHSMCSHGLELCEMSSGPIAIFSEQEHWNRHMVRFKSGCGAHAKQHSIRNNLHDIFALMVRTANPLVVHRRR